MKTKLIFKTSLLFLFILLCSFAPKKELPLIVNFTQRFMAVDKNLYTDKYEVTIADYQLFLREKKEAKEDCSLLIYDSTKWRNLDYGEKDVEFYFNYHGYANAPIVCISHYAAGEFCKWLTEKYNADSQKKFKKVVFRLPTESEYKKAAISNYDLGKIYYPWGTNELYSKGEKRCNFFELRQEGLDFSENNLKYHKFMPTDLIERFSPVDSYEPNPYGLYNMVGNVSEMIQEEHYAMGGDWLSTGYNVRITSKKKYDEPSPTVGFRVYMEILEF